MLGLISSLVVDLSSQQIHALSDTGSILLSAPISSGKANSPTPTGEFYIYGKYPRTDLVGADYRINLPYVMCLAGPGITADMYCIHPTPYPEQPLGKPASRGCVRTSVATARWLFDRTKLSTPVFIHK